MSGAKIVEHVKTTLVKLFQMNLGMKILVFLNSDIVIRICFHYWAEVSVLGIAVEVWINFDFFVGLLGSLLSMMLFLFTLAFVGNSKALLLVWDYFTESQNVQSWKGPLWVI